MLPIDDCWVLASSVVSVVADDELASPTFVWLTVANEDFADAVVLFRVARAAASSCVARDTLGGVDAPVASDFVCVAGAAAAAGPVVDGAERLVARGVTRGAVRLTAFDSVPPVSGALPDTAVDGATAAAAAFKSGVVRRVLLVSAVIAGDARVDRITACATTSFCVSKLVPVYMQQAKKHILLNRTSAANAIDAQPNGACATERDTGASPPRKSYNNTEPTSRSMMVTCCTHTTDSYNSPVDVPTATK